MMNITGKRLLSMVLAGLGYLLMSISAQAQNESAADESGAAPQSAAQIQAYWTAERMASAQPMPAPAGNSAANSAYAATPAPMPAADMVVQPGWNPNSGLPQPTLADAVVIKKGSSTQNLAQPQAVYGSPPSNPRDGPYGPFQRRSLMGKYVNFPRSIIGKLFFTLNGGNFVCSGTVINRNAVMTAGHCNSDGAGAIATNRLFCPSYNAGGANASVGCWSVYNSYTSSGWRNSGNPDNDYSCLLTNSTGTVRNTRIGLVTGWAGALWNGGDQLSVVSHGYPAASPFNGNNIVQVNGPMWYTWDGNGAGGQISNVMGNDSTGGSSGGGWFTSWNHPSVEVADTDGNNTTDPFGAGGPFIMGVNSHKRCTVSCQNPPTTSNGVFWQEMTSPPFRKTGTSDEAEDVYTNCMNGGGNT